MVCVEDAILFMVFVCLRDWGFPIPFRGIRFLIIPWVIMQVSVINRCIIIDLISISLDLHSVERLLFFAYRIQMVISLDTIWFLYIIYDRFPELRPSSDAPGSMDTSLGWSSFGGPVLRLDMSSNKLSNLELTIALELAINLLNLDSRDKTVFIVTVLVTD